MSATPEQKKSRAQEKRTAETYRGSVNAMSGAGWVRKADVRTHAFLIENKTRMDPKAKSYTVKLQDMVALTKRARLEGRLPFLQFDMGGKRYVVLNEDDWLDVIGEEDE